MKTASSLAFRWLEAEDSYQWQRDDVGKFAIQADIAALYSHASGSNWTDITLTRWGRFAFFRDRNAWSHAVQNMGKLAAIGRALSVTVTVAYGDKIDSEHFEKANKQSLERLALFDDTPSGQESQDWRQADFNETQFGMAYDALSLPFSSRMDITQDTGRKTRILAYTGMKMLAGAIDFALENEYDLPRPGVRSGVIEKWDI